MTTGRRAGAIDLGMINRHHWNPGRTVMTGFANQTGVDVTRRQCSMTTGRRTGAIDLGMVDRDHWRPGVGGMTGFANVGRVHVTIR